MATIVSLPPRSVAVVLLLAMGWLCPARASAQDGPPIDVLSINKVGKLVAADEDALAKIVARFKAEPPTHVFVLSHGWFNSRDIAAESYRKMAAQMTQVADECKLRPEGFKPAVIGLHWPSLAFENDEDLIRILLRGMPKTSAALKALLKFQLKVDDLEALLNKQMSKDDVIAAFSKIRLFLGDELSIPDAKTGPDLKVLSDDELKSVLDAARVFTFWQMKKRAGTVGANGARRVLLELQTAAPKAQFHLAGHSFGCKVLLSALAGDEKLAPVRSLVLIQAAISADAFAKKGTVPRNALAGAFNVVLTEGRVKGPIVATFSKFDLAVGLAYPPASRAAGQIAELEARIFDLPDKAYRGMGAVGITGVETMPARKLNDNYGFQPGLHSVDASDIIAGHNQFYTNDVAWLIWNAILSR